METETLSIQNIDSFWRVSHNLVITIEISYYLKKYQIVVAKWQTFYKMSDESGDC